MVEAYVKISRTGLLCLVFLSAQALASAQQDPPQQQTPPQPQTQDPQQPESGRLRLPPVPPKVIDVRMPGEAGWFIGLTAWLPIGKTYTDKGTLTTFTDPSLLQMQGKSRGAFGLDFGVAAGLHNSVRFSYFFNKQNGNTTLDHNLVVFAQGYNAGDVVSTNSKLTNYKLSYEYLTWPYPVEARHFRLKTLFQVQYTGVRAIFDAPVKSSTPDSNGILSDYSTLGTKGFITPALGLGLHAYASRNFRFEANVSGFAWPHSFHLLDTDAAIAYRAGKIELRGGAKGFIFRTSPKHDYFYRGSVAGLFVGLRWYSD